MVAGAAWLRAGRARSCWWGGGAPGRARAGAARLRAVSGNTLRVKHLF